MKIIAKKFCVFLIRDFTYINITGTGTEQKKQESIKYL